MSKQVLRLSGYEPEPAQTHDGACQPDKLCLVCKIAKYAGRIAKCLGCINQYSVGPGDNVCRFLNPGEREQPWGETYEISAEELAKIAKYKAAP